LIIEEGIKNHVTYQMNTNTNKLEIKFKAPSNSTYVMGKLKIVDPISKEEDYIYYSYRP
jgi:hypothetical protein